MRHPLLWSRLSSREARWAIPLIGALVLATAGAAAILTRPERREVTVQGGTTIVAALDHTISTEQNHAGDAITLQTTEPMPFGTEGSIPAGAVVRGEVTHIRGGGRVAGAPELTLRFTELEIEGERYVINAAPFRLRGENDAGQSAATVGSGAGAGGVLGAVLGGKSGLVKGAIAGAVLGTGVAVATKGDQLTLPAGQRLRVQLVTPLTLRLKVATS